jgi:hypothetical protein
VVIGIASNHYYSIYINLSYTLFTVYVRYYDNALWLSSNLILPMHEPTMLSFTFFSIDRKPIFNVFGLNAAGVTACAWCQ